LELLKPFNKGTKMNFWEALYMQAFHQRNILIEEQKVNDINPLCELAQHDTKPVMHALTQSTSEQGNTSTSTRVSPANFDTIYLILKILLIQYWIHCIHYRPAEKLQRDLDRLWEWAAENVMNINQSKSKAVRFTRARVRDPLNYTLGDQLIPEMSSCKYLGHHLTL
jgi:hypothetical protein